MSQDPILLSKIELLEEQIENIERSGFFTEKEIDRASYSLREELESLRSQTNLYGMTAKQYKEGLSIHKRLFAKLSSLLNMNLAINKG